MGVLTDIWSVLRAWYFHWELCTCVYVMEPTEKLIFHTVFFFILGLFIFAAVTYLPQQLEDIAKFAFDVTIGRYAA